MKYRLLLFILLLGSTAHAQFRAEKRVFKMGVNFVDVVSSSTNFASPEHDLKPALNLGFAADFRLGRSPLCLRIGGQYQPRGFFDKTDLGNGLSYTRNLSLHYLDLPVDLVLATGGENTKLYASAGGYVGYAVYGRLTRRANGFDFLVVRQVGEKDSVSKASVLRENPFSSTSSTNFRRLDYGMNFAVGFERNNFQVGITYGLGLANLTNAPRQTLYNRALGLFLYYRFDDM